jgi:glycosyltransferase involved in cell wall biosynthesis
MLAVNIVSEKETHSGVRYSSLDLHAFLGDSQLSEWDTSGQLQGRLNAVVSIVEGMLQERYAKPCILNVSPQGFHERSKRLVMSLTDTGGQDQYIENISAVFAAKGFHVINVNRGGPNHPVNNDVRHGLHLYADGVDLLFVDDGSPEFVLKENMYDQFEPAPGTDGFSSLRRVRSGPCATLAQDLAVKLDGLPHVEVVIGHYADGGEVARLFTELWDKTAKNHPLVWHIPHSTGMLKEETLRRAGHPESDFARFNFGNRAETERKVYESAVVFSTSDAITHSVVDHYGCEVAQQIPIGVETERFHPREVGVERTHPKYDKIWQQLSALSGRSVAELQNAQMVLEYSRTVPTKGKETVIRAFAESIKDAEKDRILVISIGDPASKGLSANDQEYARMLRNLVDELGLKGRVIYKDSFPNGECAALCQIADVFMSGATMETWGMAVQEAAASGLPIISTDIVPITDELLVGKDRVEDAQPDGTVIVKGRGAWMIRPNDFRSAARALNELFAEQHDGGTLRAQLGQEAFRRVIPAYTWGGILESLMAEHGKFVFQGGKVIWSQETGVN